MHDGGQCELHHGGGQVHHPAVELVEVMVKLMG